jgi:hypothetical protein
MESTGEQMHSPLAVDALERRSPQVLEYEA